MHNYVQYCIGAHGWVVRLSQPREQSSSTSRRWLPIADSSRTSQAPKLHLHEAKELSIQVCNQKCKFPLWYSSKYCICKNAKNIAHTSLPNTTVLGFISIRPISLSKQLLKCIRSKNNEEQLQNSGPHRATTCK